ncbi:MAG: efflux RND transporter periplasmic adaptor subunit [Alphaproteobacteria bacterium]
MKRLRIDRSIVAAAVVAALLAAWQLSGLLPRDTGLASETRAAEEVAAPAAVSVRVRTLSARPHKSDLTVRGRTEAVRKDSVRAEVEGVVTELPVAKGGAVKAGDVICQLSIDSRQARLEQARAVLEQRKLEYEANSKLVKKGFRSETQIAAARAAYDAARAQLKAIEIEMGDTRIRAPYDGVLDERPVEMGDFMRKGDICGMVVDQDPFLVVGQVAEKEVGLIEPGAPGRAELVTGQTVSGKVRFISNQADPATRTFRVELEVPNPGGTLRDGVTAVVQIPLREVQAHLIPASILSLNDAGQRGVRAVDSENRVRFRPVEIIAQAGDGAWVTGLPDRVKVITVGQEYVIEGQTVRPVPEEDPGA